MRLTVWFGFIVIAAATVPLHAQSSDGSLSPDDSLRIYAVNVVHSRPLEEPFIGYGIYLGQGAVITAAHVVGRWPSFISNPRVLIAGQELPAKIIKEGSADTIDIALLSVDEARLPVSLRLRRNPLCKAPPRAGEDVIVVLSYGTVRSRIIFPQLLPPRYRTNFNTFISDVPIAGGSGSGIFRAERKCLLGILTSKIWEYNFRMENGRIVRDLAKNTVDIARHFVPASTIVEFMPPEFRF
jgi:Trypsin-like peptidase domain